MAATMRLLLAFGGIAQLLVCTVAFERSHVVDDVPLVQKDWRTEHLDLSSAPAPDLQATMRQMALNLQLPFPPDVSVGQILIVTQTIFKAFRNNSFVASMRESLSNNTRDFTEFLSTFRTSISKLQGTTSRSRSEEHTLEALEEFWRTCEDAWSVFLAKVAASSVTISVRQPSEALAIEKAFRPLFNSSIFDNIGAANLPLERALEGSFSQYRANEIFLDKRTVCAKLKALWPKVLSFEPRLMVEMIPALSNEQSRKQVQNMCEAFAPDASDNLVGVMNLALKVALSMAKDWQPVLHDSVTAVEAVMGKGLRCELPRAEEQTEQQAEHAGGTCSRLSAASLAVAAAAGFTLGL